MKNEQKQKRVPLRNLLLRSLATVGVVSIVLIAPNMTRLLKEFDRPAKNRTQLYRRINQGIQRLKERGLVKVTGAYSDRRITITKKGLHVIGKIRLGEYKIPEPAFWDGKWRVLIFDIREKRRLVRSQLRTLIRSAGFIRIQDSVWVYPYPCDEFIALVRAHLKSGTGEVRSFVAEALESDKALREHFKL